MSLDRPQQQPPQQQYYDVAFIFGNEGTGLNEKHINSCHTLVRIPQYNTGTASLNVATAASIVLYQFHQWQRRHTQLIQNQKSINQPINQPTNNSNSMK
jgi:tRNA C32,U32 (ribose-2'-O)-methylase TrmJ